MSEPFKCMLCETMLPSDYPFTVCESCWDKYPNDPERKIDWQQRAIAAETELSRLQTENEKQLIQLTNFVGMCDKLQTRNIELFAENESLRARVGEWVKCSDRLPDKGQAVFFWNGKLYRGVFWECMWINDETGLMPIDIVTHWQSNWQPLPPPPAQIDKEGV